MKRLALLLLCIIGLAHSASAHEMRPAYLRVVQQGDDIFQVTWKVPTRNGERQDLYVEFPEPVESLSTPTSGLWEGAVVERYTIKCPGGLKGHTIQIGGLVSTLTDALVRIERLDDTTETARLSPETPSFVVQGSPTTLGVAKAYTVLGAQHIWEGIDHLLFVACLVMIAGTGRRIFITITGFTIAHSITLAASALGFLTIPIPPVEAVIALSIIFLAMEIVRNDKETLTWRYPMAVSVSFGLLHGFGFASALSEIGLPQKEVATALLFFNVGVELGQIAFIFAIIMALALLKKLSSTLKIGQSPKAARAFTLTASYAVGTLATCWLLERVRPFWPWP